MAGGPGPVWTLLLCADWGHFAVAETPGPPCGKHQPGSVPRGWGRWVNPGGARDAACTPWASRGKPAPSPLTEAPAHISRVSAAMVVNMSSGLPSCTRFTGVGTKAQGVSGGVCGSNPVLRDSKDSRGINARGHELFLGRTSMSSGA